MIKSHKAFLLRGISFLALTSGIAAIKPKYDGYDRKTIRNAAMAIMYGEGKK